MEFGDKIYQFRKERGLSQEKFAEQLGVTKQAVQKWELGKSQPETSKLIKLAKFFNMERNVSCVPRLLRGQRIPPDADAYNGDFYEPF